MSERSHSTCAHPSAPCHLRLVHSAPPDPLKQGYFVAAERMAGLWREIVQAEAKLDDLRRQLAAAKAEMHGLQAEALGWDAVTT